MQRGSPPLQTLPLSLFQPQYLISTSYYCTKQGHQSPSRKEALRACFGGGPSYECLIGIPALRFEVKVKAIPTESQTLFLSTPDKRRGSSPLLATATIPSFKFYSILNHHQVRQETCPLG